MPQLSGKCKKKTRIPLRAADILPLSKRSIMTKMEGICMNQTIHCSVSSCRHHSGQGNCQLDAIDVRPNCNCHTGKCDESMCGSYDKK